ncbi:MAG TPA: hypothetical protein VKH37_08190 [Ferruginibacter sp.]|nr:hypothetical protein [Ferruginibacter sp.]
MKKSIHKLLLLTALLISDLILMSSCSKDGSSLVNNTANSSSIAGNAANSGSINRPAENAPAIFDVEFLVRYASDNGSDITNQFQGISLKFESSAATTGNAYAFTSWRAIQGTWVQEDGKQVQTITFTYPTGLLPVLAFLNRKWSYNYSEGAVVLSAGNSILELIPGKI